MLEPCPLLPTIFKKKKKTSIRQHTLRHLLWCASPMAAGACWWIVQRRWLIPPLHPVLTLRKKPAQPKKIERRLSSSLDFFYPWRQKKHSRWSSSVRLIHIHRSYIMKRTHTHWRPFNRYLLSWRWLCSRHPSIWQLRDFLCFPLGPYFFALKVHFWRRQQILICPEKLWIDFFSPRRQCKLEFVFNLQNKFKFMSVPVTFFFVFLLFWDCFCNLFLSYFFILWYYWCCSYWNPKFPEGLIKFLSIYLWKYISVMQEMTVMKRSPGEKCWKFECRRRP